VWITFRALMGIAVIACICASATFAFEFGWTRGATLVAHWTYAIAGVALDLFKSGLPILGATAWHDSKPARSFACWIVFIVLTGLSLWCAYGTTATQLAEKFATQAVAQSDLSIRQATLDRLRAQRDAFKFTETSEEAVRTVEATVITATEQAAAERARGGCKDICRQREGEERDARAALLLAQQNRAATVKVADLDVRIAAAEVALMRSTRRRPLRRPIRSRLVWPMRSAPIGISSPPCRRHSLRLPSSSAAALGSGWYSDMPARVGAWRWIRLRSRLSFRLTRHRP